jgi:hypothetical protein
MLHPRLHCGGIQVPTLDLQKSSRVMASQNNSNWQKERKKRGPKRKRQYTEGNWNSTSTSTSTSTPACLPACKSCCLPRGADCLEAGRRHPLDPGKGGSNCGSALPLYTAYKTGIFFYRCPTQVWNEWCVSGWYGCTVKWTRGPKQRRHRNQKENHVVKESSRKQKNCRLRKQAGSEARQSP